MNDLGGEQTRTCFPISFFELKFLSCHFPAFKKSRNHPISIFNIRPKVQINRGTTQSLFPREPRQSHKGVIHFDKFSIFRTRDGDCIRR